MTQSTSPRALARKVATLLALLPQVEAIALGGSQVSNTPDANSDIDLYVFTRAEIALADRERVVQGAGDASRANLGLSFWGAGDEWFDAATGIEVDVVYFDAQWLADELDRVLRQQQPALGYTTCLWHTVRSAQVMHDPNGWLGALQTFSLQPYPDGLRRNIVAWNHPVLRNVIPAYATQLQKAVKRDDLVSVNHRLAALLASYFDIIFAVNRVPHPGEKRLVAKALAHCASLPVDMALEVESSLRASAMPGAPILAHLARLLNHLDQWLNAEGFDLPACHSYNDMARGAVAPPTRARRIANQGDIYWVTLASPGELEPAIPHPYVVVQDNIFNHSRIHTVVACALTSNIGRMSDTPGNVLLAEGEANLPRQSVVEVSKVTTIEKTQLGEYIGSLTEQRVGQILAGMRFLQLSYFDR